MNQYELFMGVKNTVRKLLISVLPQISAITPINAGIITQRSQRRTALFILNCCSTRKYPLIITKMSTPSCPPKPIKVRKRTLNVTGSVSER